MKSIFSFLLILSAITPLSAQQENAEKNLQIIEGNVQHERRARREIWDEAQHLVLKRDFSELERISTLYRNEKSLTPSGDWKLRHFYNALASTKTSFDESELEGARRRERVAREWLEKIPTSPTASVLIASELLAQGWTQRGYGPGSSVSDKQARIFRAFVRDAKAQLVASASYAKVDPEWHHMMIETMMLEGGPVDEYFGALHQALNLAPTYIPLAASAVRRFQPKWGGSIDDLDAIINSIASRNNVEDGKIMYTRMYIAVSRELTSPAMTNIFRDSKADWSKVKEGFEALLARHPTLWNKNLFAEFACDAGDGETFERLIKENILEERLWAYNSRLRVCLNWAGPGAGPSND
ncbi:hypothetical protein [Methylocella sp. CPCC 101449]|uniref:hypothetical protein n=1 Tax=Methylocella sp. CPCC 101449 TaxID=2987531 RepID=UPI00289162A2|nr:hypothetical protein [Methylocella sp. CPCC 101449]MDT2020472.1 hypothetical protein [Methylocella sp. CPCC 101449]